jgi:hypothetical protein
LDSGGILGVEIITESRQHTTQITMKKLLLPALIGLSALTLLSGCLDLQLGGGTTSRPQSPTVGQELIDLQKARDAGAINDSEYQAQKARLLSH